MNDKSVARLAKEDRLFELAYAEAEGQYGASGSEELDIFMDHISDQIAAMSDEELDEKIAERGG